MWKTFIPEKNHSRLERQGKIYYVKIYYNHSYGFSYTQKVKISITPNLSIDLPFLSQ